MPGQLLMETDDGELPPNDFLETDISSDDFDEDELVDFFLKKGN